MSETSPIRWAAIIGALLILVFCIWQVISGLGRVHGARAGIERLQSKTSTVETINPQSWVIESASHGAAGAQLQARLRASARASDISLTRVEVQPPDSGEPALVRATAQANGSTRAMARFFYHLESQHPALILERARISDDENGGLDVDLVILARTRIGEGQ